MTGPAASTDTARSTQHGTFVVERTLDFAPARVFFAWADPAERERGTIEILDNLEAALRRDSTT